MPLSYDPSEEEEGGGDLPPLKPGVYEFKVDEAKEDYFQSGNRGIKAKLLVAYNNRDVPCFANLVYTPKMLWKVRHFVESIGLSFEDPPEVSDLIGGTGEAQFVVNDRGYFEVKDFIVPEDAGKHEAPGPGVGSDDVPF